MRTNNLYDLVTDFFFAIDMNICILMANVWQISEEKSRSHSLHSQIESARTINTAIFFLTTFVKSELYTYYFIIMSTERNNLLWNIRKIQQFVICFSYSNHTLISSIINKYKHVYIYNLLWSGHFKNFPRTRLADLNQRTESICISSPVLRSQRRVTETINLP